MSRTITTRTEPKKKAVAYQNKAYGDVYFPGEAGSGGGVLLVVGNKIFVPFTYSETLFQNDAHIPLYKGDVIEITL